MVETIEQFLMKRHNIYRERHKIVAWVWRYQVITWYSDTQFCILCCKTIILYDFSIAYFAAVQHNYKQGREPFLCFLIGFHKSMKNVTTFIEHTEIRSVYRQSAWKYTDMNICPYCPTLIRLYLVEASTLSPQLIYNLSAF